MHSEHSCSCRQTPEDNDTCLISAYSKPMKSIFTVKESGNGPRMIGKEEKALGKGDKKGKGLGMFQRLFARRGSDVSAARVFTVSDTTGGTFFEEEIVQDASSSPPGSDSMSRSRGERSSQPSVPHISLLRRAATYDSDLALLRSSPSSSPHSRSPSPLVRLSAGDLFSVEDDAVSLSSSMTSFSTESMSSLTDSCESGRDTPQFGGERLRDGSSGDEGREREKPQPLSIRAMKRQARFGSEGRTPRTRHLSDEDRHRHPHHRCVSPLTSSRCQSASALHLQQDEVEGPHGKLFTAWLFNRIGRKGALSNVTHVNHVYKGTALITDLLGDRIVFAARSGRSAKVFATEQGAEPWCACITPRGHVAVTLRRPACVTVWSGHGSLVREFGHAVLKCPTGLACDRQGRFIVTDERSNRVAVFSPSGEFLHFLRQASPQAERSKTAAARAGKERTEQSSDSASRSGDREAASGDTSGDEADDEDMEGDWQGPDNNGNERNGNARSKRVRWQLDGDEDESPCDNSDSASQTGSKINSRTNTTTTTNEDVTEITENDTGVKDSPTGERNNNDNDYKPFVFNLPRYVCVTMSGKIVVSDSGSHSVKVFSPEGVYLHAIGSHGSDDGQLKVPYGVCCDQHDNIYIADHYNDRVSVFSLDGVFLQHALTSLSGLSRPKSIAVRPAHVRKLYIAHGGLRATEVLVYRLVAGRDNVAFKCDV